MSLQRMRVMVRELQAWGRNYHQAALLRRHVRSNYGVVFTARPSALIGEALVALDHAPWGRITVLIVLVLIAARR